MSKRHPTDHTADTVDGAEIGDTFEREGESAIEADGDGGSAERSEAADGSPIENDPQSELAAERDRYLRLAAEYDNFRKRSLKERIEAESRGQAELSRSLIEALDDIARFAHIDPASTDTTTLVQGVEMVEKKMAKALGAAGLEVVNPVDQPFDPAIHEAVATEPATSPDEDHLVARVYQPGYLFKGQLLRPARVVVRQWNG